MHDPTRTANLLGAAALAVNDSMLAAVARSGLPAPSGAAALVVLLTAPGVGVTELGRRIGLSQSATTRLIDTLETDGLVARRASAGRQVRVHLTRRGRSRAQQTLAARCEPLLDVLSELDEAGQRDLDRLLRVLLTGLYQRSAGADHVCRLCDRACCTAGAVCPVGVAERAERE